MKTIGTRLALLYCLISTVTLFALLGVGYYFLHQHVVKSLAVFKGVELRGQPFQSEAFLDAGVDEVMIGYAQMSLVLICLALLVSLISGLLLSKLAMRPIRVIQETANRIRSDNLSERIPVSGVQDEISSLAQLLNSMFDRLESSFHQIQKFSAEASHELKTPLSLIRLHAEKLLIEGKLACDQEETIQMQLEEVSHLNQIIDDLLFLSRAEAHAVTVNFQQEDPTAFLVSFAADARLLAEHVGVRFNECLENGGPVRYDPKWMRQVLLNLVTNALKVAPVGSLLTLESLFTVDVWRLAIEDEGPGVPVEQRERIFERFVRGGTFPNSDQAEGSGLGLAICRSIISFHGGWIRAEAGTRRGGLRIICDVPLRESSQMEPSVGPASSVHVVALD